jgi:hypothetical protein
MTTALIAQRCANHPVREAVARCPECHGFFCRECIIEHDDRVICSACLKRITVKVRAKKRRVGFLLRPAQLAFGLLLAWLFFYCVGRVLISIPPAYHEGAVWQTGTFEDNE